MTEFVQRLALVRLWAGNPSFEELRRRTGVPSSTLSDAVRAGRTRLPRLEVVRKFLTACGGTAGEVVRWEWAWRRLQVREVLASGRARSSAVRPRQTPTSGIRLVGRHDALTRLDRLSRAHAPGGRQATIVALVGMAGVGKTALALHWARRVVETFEGQLYVDLRGHAAAPATAASEALESFLCALGVPSQAIPAGVTSRLGLYRSLSHGRRLLVILDGARDADQVRLLLPGGTGCFTLITSRDRLASLVAREGAELVRVTPLCPVDAQVLVTEALTRHRPPAEPAVVNELVQLCGCLPLALRIAVANLLDHPHMSVSAYLARLRGDHPLAELVVAGDHSTSVRAALDHSYVLLDAAARRLLVDLAAAPRPAFTTAEAATLGGLSRSAAARLLGALCAAHLIEAVDLDRYTLHSLVRAYAAERAIMIAP